MSKKIELNPQQKIVTSWRKGALLVLAGAGAGKTATLIQTILAMIEAGIDHRSILVQTFTNKAGKELKERLAHFLGDRIAAEITAGTFHSFCWKVLSYEIPELKNKNVEQVIVKDFRAIQTIELLLKEEAESAVARGERMPVEEDAANVLKRFSMAKNNLIFPDDEDQARAYFEGILGQREGARNARLYRFYNAKIRAMGQMDFDDWLLDTFRLFMDRPEVLAKYTRRFQYIMSDEVQDQNKAQNAILKLLASGSGNIFMVGDVKQSIFGFRGAAPEATVLAFKDDYPSGTVAYLEYNYRCDGAIISAANNLTACMDSIPEKYRGKLIATKPEVNVPEIVSCSTSEEEGFMVVDQIKAAIADGVKAQEIAVLYRTNAMSAFPEQALIQAKIPYVIIGGSSFYERKEVKDMIGYLEILANANSYAASDAVKRVLNYASTKFAQNHKGRDRKPLWSHLIGKEFIAGAVAMAKNQSKPLYTVLRQYAQTTPGVYATQKDGIEDFVWIVDSMRKLVEEGKNPGEILRWVFDTVYTHHLSHTKSDDEGGEGDARKENCYQLINDMQRFSTVDKALAFIHHLMEQASKNKEAKEAVQLMSLHRSKGLEFERVFCIGWNEGVLPHAKAEQIEEERRLAYVGITRAKEKVMISFSEGKSEPSRFLYELGIPGYAYEDGEEGQIEGMFNSLATEPRPSEVVEGEPPVSLMGFDGTEDAEFLASLGVAPEVAEPRVKVLTASEFWASKSGDLEEIPLK